MHSTALTLRSAATPALVSCSIRSSDPSSWRAPSVLTAHGGPTSGSAGSSGGGASDDLLRLRLRNDARPRDRVVFLMLELSLRPLAAAAFALLFAATTAAASEWPVVFIHGFCSSAETWNETLPQLSSRRFGTDAPRIYESAIGKAGARSEVAAGTKTFRIDFSDLAN